MIDIPGGSVAAAIAAFILFAILAGVAYLVFRMLRQTVRMAFRMAIVAAILTIALFGSLALWWMNSASDTPAKTRPAPAKKR